MLGPIARWSLCGQRRCPRCARCSARAGGSHAVCMPCTSTESCAHRRRPATQACRRDGDAGREGLRRARRSRQWTRPNEHMRALDARAERLPTTIAEHERADRERIDARERASRAGACFYRARHRTANPGAAPHGKPTAETAAGRPTPIVAEDRIRRLSEPRPVPCVHRLPSIRRNGDAKSKPSLQALRAREEEESRAAEQRAAGRPGSRQGLNATRRMRAIQEQWVPNRSVTAYVRRQRFVSERVRLEALARGASPPPSSDPRRTCENAPTPRGRLLTETCSNGVGQSVATSDRRRPRSRSRSRRACRRRGSSRSSRGGAEAAAYAGSCDVRKRHAKRRRGAPGLRPKRLRPPSRNLEHVSPSHGPDATR